jgi:flagellar biosynthesis/type III secretory pathway ATPase
MNSNTVDMSLVIKLLEILDYICRFNKDVSSTSRDLHIDMSKDIESDIDNKENIIKLLQYQDIMSQQLDSSVCVMDKIDKSINEFIDGSINFDTLFDILSKDYNEFRNKYDSFKGTRDTGDNRVDFF